MCPAKDRFIYLTLLFLYMTFVLSLTQTLVLLSLYQSDGEHTSVYFGLGGSTLFCACLVSAHVPAPCVIGVGHLSLQADGKVAFEEIPGSSLYLFVPVLTPKYT